MLGGGADVEHLGLPCLRHAGIGSSTPCGRERAGELLAAVAICPVGDIGRRAPTSAQRGPADLSLNLGLSLSLGLRAA